AVRNLRKGTIIGLCKRLGEALYPWEKYAKLDRQTMRMIDKYCTSTEEGFWGPDDINYLSLLWHMNHNCSGNVGFDEQGNFTTIRYVRAGEELTTDYGLQVSNPRFKLKCKCGSMGCRKIITGDDWKNPVFRRKHRLIMLPELRDLKSNNSENDGS
ncbi:MAG: SET domain-containing protein-lysine N-methyltransferase, partial [Proteobacteria bacterium]|nr:SET domain-containing protein-lysine N-methyltransferase [Pseudomonadota bacterium]